MFVLESVNIVKEPSHEIFVDDGPIIGKTQRVVLKVETTGWPLPTFQWYRNGVLLEGETKAELVRNLKCNLNTATRTYR